MNMHLTNHIKSIVQSMLVRQGVPRWGMVTSVNPNDATCKVCLQPDHPWPPQIGYESGWLPVACVAAGGAHIMALPSYGDQVLVHPDCGDAEHGIVTLACHGGTTRPPVSPATGKPAQAGEILIMQGALYFHMVNGAIYMGGGNLVVDGTIVASGNVQAGFGTADEVDVLGHTHRYNPGTGSPTPTTAPIAGT